MPEACAHCLGHLNICIYYAHQTRAICQVLLNSTDFKALVQFEIYWDRQYLVNIT